MRAARLLAAIGAVVLASAVEARPASPAAVDAAVARGMARVGSKGLAVAVVDGGRVAWAKAYGARDAAGDPLTRSTILYAASLTKTVFAYTVMRLVDQGRVDLDQPIAEMLPRPLPDYGNLPHGMGNWGDLAADPRWRAITPRMVLTHATGFANYAFLEPDQRLHIHFDPGTRYAYSGEGMLLLQFAIEQKLGRPIETLAEALTFAPLGMADTRLVWQDRWADRAASAWDAAGAIHPHHPNPRARASGSMDTTIDDMARFAAAVVSGAGLSGAAQAEMLRPQRPITTASQFPTLQAELPVDRRRPDLSAGLGVVTFTGPQGPGFLKGGHDDQTANTMVCLRRRQRCVVILSNDVRSEALFPDLVRAALGETGAPWRWEYPEQFAGAQQNR